MEAEEKENLIIWVEERWVRVQDEKEELEEIIRNCFNMLHGKVMPFSQITGSLPSKSPFGS